VLSWTKCLPPTSLSTAANNLIAMNLPSMSWSVDASARRTALRMRISGSGVSQA
jgi:hypothetical protein